MSLPSVSPRAPRRKSVSLMERNMNSFDDNMTMPVTNRERTKGKRGVSFGGEALTASFDGGLSEAQQRRRKMQPRKSILKMAIDDSLDSSGPTDNSTALFTETVDFGAIYSHMDPSTSTSARAPRQSMPATSASGRQSLGPRRRVSFAPSAHVRMFENKDKEKKPRRKSSMGMGAHFAPSAAIVNNTTSPSKSRQSLPVGSSSRRSSIQAQPPHSSAPVSPARYFVGEGEGGGEESMELESESDFSDDSADMDEMVDDFPEPQPRHLPDEGNDSYATDSDGEMDMEETEVVGSIPQQYSEADTAGEEDMSLESNLSVASNDEEKTMDFTVALGGPMPRVAPQGALRSRASIGYSHPSAPGESPLLPGDGEESEMEETVAYGGVYVDESMSSGEDTNSSGDHERHTATYNFNTGRSGMEFTTAVGGINHTAEHDYDDDGMDFTTVGGGINDQTQGMDFTVAGGGIEADESGMAMATVGGGINDQTQGMDFTTVVGGVNFATATYSTNTNIFAPTPRTEPTQTMATNIFAPRELTRTTNIFAQEGTDYLGTSGFSYPILSPAKPESASAPTGMLSDSDETRRLHTSTSAPIRTTPKATPRKSTSGMSGGTPSFARPTTSSAQKNRPSQLPVPSTKKKNPFAPSPDTPGLQRSKSRTPRKSDAAMETAASVAKRLSFAPSAPDNAFSSAPSLAASTSAPTTSTPRKRSREEDDDRPASAKRAHVKHNIFAASEPEPEVAQPVAPAPLEEFGADGEDEDMELEAEDNMELAQDEVEDEGQDEGQEDDAEAHYEIRVTEPTTSHDEIATNPEFHSPEPEPERPLPVFTGTPRRSMGLGPARRSMTPNKAALKSPARRISYYPPPPEEEEEEEPSQEEEEEDAPITLHQFLSMANVQFLDDLAAAPRRRSSVGYGLLGSEDREYAPSDFAVANTEAIFVNMYNWAIEKMKSDIAAGQEELDTTEKLCNEENPVVIREYLAANAEDRKLFESTLLEFKINTTGRARSQWYDWKLSLMEKIMPDVREIRDEMAADAARHAQDDASASTLLPDLRRRHDELKSELARHRAAVVEIEKCDQDELRELKAAVVEQDVEIERFTAERDDKATTVTNLQNKADKLEDEIASHRSAIERARAECDESTPSDVLRLQSELGALQDLHGWRLARATPVELVFADELLLTVPLINNEAHIPSSQLSLTTTSTDGPNEGLLAITRAALASRPLPVTLPSLVRSIGQIWTAARHVRDELNLVKLYYPITTRSTDTALLATAALMLPAQRARVRLSFAVEANTLLEWPAVGAVANLAIKVEAVYGAVNVKALAEAARECLSRAVPDVPGMLVEACTSAIDAA